MKLLARLLWRQETAVLALLIAALAALPFSLRIAAPDAALSLLLPAAWIGASCGYLLGGLRQRQTQAVAALVLLGWLGLFIRVGQLTEAVLTSVGQMLRWIGVLVLPSPNVGWTLAEETAWWNTLVPLAADVSSLASRVAIWMAGVTQNQPGTDMAARAFCLGAAIWLLSIWAGWRVRSKSDALGALLPASAWIAVSLNARLQDRWPLWLHISAFLLLLAVLNLWGLTGRWTREKTDYSDAVPEDTLLNATVLIMLLLVVGYSASVFSLKDMIDRLREHPRAASAAVSSGAGTGAGRVLSGLPGGLENTHLITAGPKLTKDVVMVISTGELPPMQHPEGVEAPRYDWRGATYQTYTGRGWTNPTLTVIPADASTAFLPQAAAGFRSMHGTVELPPQAGGAAYWAGMLVDADSPLDVLWRAKPELSTAVPTPIIEQGDADMIGAQFSTDAAEGIKQYHFASLISTATGQQLRSSPGSYPRWVSDRYLQLPDSVPERVRALARDLTVQGATPYDRALAIETYLRKIPYSLEVPAPPTERDAADYFLFDLKKGYCDYYATSMVVLARVAELPARLVTGYSSGSYDPYTAQYIIRDADAHAWAEIYFTGFGWIEFEPTASQPAPKRELLESKAASPKTPQGEIQKWFALPKLNLRGLWMAWWAIPLVTAMLLTVLLIDDLRLRAMDPDRATRQIYRRLRRAMRPILGKAAAGETAREYAHSVSQTLESLFQQHHSLKALAVSAVLGTEELTRLYMQSLFAPVPLDTAARQRAIRTWSALRWRVALMNLFATVTRHSPRRPGAPSSWRDSPAG